MGVTPDAPARVRAGGRSERIRIQVAQACLDLLAEGKADFGPLDVVQRSGVSRATIYRWWPTKADLVTEALALHTRRLDTVPDTGSWEGDVHALVRRLARFFSDPVEVTQNAIMASGRHRDYDEVVLRYYKPLFAGWTSLVERARLRGEVRDEVDADTVILLLISPLLMAPLVLHRKLSHVEVRDIADLIVAATSTG
jgi:AcrR family transcriptional regulator